MKKIRIRDVQALCELYEVEPGGVEFAVEMAKQAKVVSWCSAFSGLYSDPRFHIYIELVASARQLTVYNEVVFSLLQTVDYARAMISGFYRDESPEEIERRVELRMKRQTVVTRKADPVELELLLHESALHRMIGSPRVMAAQLRHLAEMSKLPNITLRVHPFAGGCARGLVHGPFVILDFGSDSKDRPIEPPLVYAEGGGKPDLYLENPDDVRLYREIAAAIRSTALDEVQTRDLLRRAARSFVA